MSSGCSQFTAMEFQTQRGQLTDALMREVDRQLAQMGTEIVGLQLINTVRSARGPA
jgi:hypothetical protein